MALYAIGDLHLHFQSPLKSQRQMRERVWKNHEEVFRRNCEGLLTPEDTLVLVGDHSWGRKLEECEEDFRYIEKVAINWAEHGITTSKQAERAVSGFGKNRRGSGAGTRPAANPFNQFEQNQYDFDQLEKELLSN